MTIEELFIKIYEMSGSTVLWFESGFQTLVAGDWLQLTIGQALFTVLAGILTFLLIAGLWAWWCDHIDRIGHAAQREQRQADTARDDS